ncbi:MAG: DHHA1 domain-containing protein [Candidatus Aenigmatarchaeota archaeon]
MKNLILCHADADGMCSGAIALSKFPGSEIFFTKPVSLLADLKDVRADRIIITDIAITKRDAPAILNMLREKAKSSEIWYFDHHPLPSNINEGDIAKVVKWYHRLDVSSSEIIYENFKTEIPRERVWVAIYGAISDYAEYTPFIQKVLKNWEKRALYFEVSTLVLGTKVEEFSTYDIKRDIVKLLARGGNPSDFYGLVNAAKAAVGLEFDLYNDVKAQAKQNGNVAWVENLHTFGFRGAAALFSATVKNTPVGLCVHSRKGHLDITVRARDPKIDLRRIIEDSAEKIGGSGGGLSDAAGARIAEGRLDDFINLINQHLKTYRGEIPIFEG